MEAIPTPKRILACDDDPDISGLIEVVLRRAGYAVDTANTHEEFFKKYADFHPDLILLDVRMPDHDGFWVAQELQRLGNKASIMFITAHNRSVYRLCEPDTVAIDFIRKPFEPEVLLEHVEKALNIMPGEPNEFLYARCERPCTEQTTE